MADKLIRHAGKIGVAVHFVAWSFAAMNWAVGWWRDGPYPGGPQFNNAAEFIGRVDVLVYGTVFEWTVRVVRVAVGWWEVDPQASVIIAFGSLLLLGGSVQWFLLGRLVQWVAARRAGRVPALWILGCCGVWVAVAAFGWWVRS